MVFYEIEHGLGTRHFLFEEHTNHTFPLHMHRCYEVVLMLDGEMNIQIDKTVHLLRTGDLILIKPHRTHSYETVPGKTSHCLLCVFSGDMIAAINEPLLRHRLSRPVLHDIPPLYREIFASTERGRDIATVKGILYLLCGLFYRELDETTEDSFSSDTLLLRDIFVYVENNISKPCTLNGLAAELKYNVSYLSRFFVRSVGIPYNEYVRNAKINHACHLLRNTDESILSIAMKCGYESPSSFNRSFKQLTGISPSRYRSLEADEGMPPPRTAHNSSERETQS